MSRSWTGIFRSGTVRIAIWTSSGAPAFGTSVLPESAASVPRDLNVDYADRVRLLGMTVRQLRYRIAKHGISVERF